MCLGKISKIRKNSFFRFLVSFKILFKRILFKSNKKKKKKKKNEEGGSGVEISIIKKI